MTRKLDFINLGDPEAVARPVMPSACETGGCGGQEPMLPSPPSFGEVRVNGVEITPEAIAEEIQHHPAPDAATAWIAAARALADRTRCVAGKSVSVRVARGGRRIIKQKQHSTNMIKL